MISGLIDSIGGFSGGNCAWPWSPFERERRGCYQGRRRSTGPSAKPLSQKWTASATRNERPSSFRATSLLQNQSSPEKEKLLETYSPPFPILNDAPNRFLSAPCPACKLVDIRCAELVSGDQEALLVVGETGFHGFGGVSTYHSPLSVYGPQVIRQKFFRSIQGSGASGSERGNCIFSPIGSARSHGLLKAAVLDCSSHGAVSHPDTPLLCTDDRRPAIPVLSNQLVIWDFQYHFR